MCASAEDGGILIDAVAAAEIGDAFGLISLGTRVLRGFSEPVPAFSVSPQEGATTPANPPLVAKAVLGD
jgi:class 3 adenylate cyclase